MDALLIFYIAGALLFVVTDQLAAVIAGCKLRPLASLAFAVTWPLSFAFAMLGSAIIISRLRKAATTGQRGG